jgi:hypothetical protein
MVQHTVGHALGVVCNSEALPSTTFSFLRMVRSYQCGYGRGR